jgi:hypothetical protein
MLVLLTATLVQAVVAQPPSNYTKIASFDGARDLTWKWREVNDPVMGGRSSATFEIDMTQKVGVFNGTCRIVPSLKAPGFCNAETEGLKVANSLAQYFDGDLLMYARSTISYDGFKISLAANTFNPQFKSYKAEFSVPASNEFGLIRVPFSKFSNDWSPFTGRCDTKDPTGKQHKCCTPQTPEVCLESKNLKDIVQIGIWAEGVAGDFHLEVQWIGGGPSV